MTKKDFEAVAKMIKENWVFSQKRSTYLLQGVVFKIADYLQTKNKRFDRSKFIKACGF
jgi:hypothetical protein